jgi:K+-sensing histidine kinase KdpD
LPNWSGRPEEVESLAARLASLLLVSLVGAAFANEMRELRTRRQVEAARAERLTLLNELMSQEMSAQLDLAATSQAVVGMVRQGLRCELAALRLDDRAAGSTAWTTEPASLYEQTRARLTSITSLVLDSERPLLVSGDQSAWRAMACAPIRLPEGTVGVLVAAGSLSRADLDLLSALAHHAALALGNARLYAHELRTAKQLRELERQKSEFLSTVSHEFRTPLTAIGSASGLLLHSYKNLTPEQHQLVRNIQRNTARLSGMVADLLESARLRDGRVALRWQTIDPLGLAQEVVGNLQPLLEGKQQRVALTAQAELPTLHADRRRLEHILTNLLANAHRHGPVGSTIQLEICATQTKSLRFCVTDQGGGVPEGERELIFEPFHADPGGTGGLGLGLAIARSLAEIQQGQLWCEAAESGGARFVLELSDRPFEQTDEDSDR